jgi:SAM-dependent methyltransferase
MNDATIARLNAINRAFYAQTGPAFDASREYVREGWHRILAELPPAQALRVLDVGCGNGFFGRFLAQNHQAPVHYRGIDADPYLLEQARQNTAGIPNLESTFDRIDFIADLGGIRALPGGYDLVTLNNVLHHVPAFDRRCALIRACCEKIGGRGLLAFTLWRFWEYEKWRGRALPWETRPKIDPEQLEPGDHLLDWRRGERAVRYCHYVDDAERTRLLECALLPDFMHEHFYADGADGRTNLYVLARRMCGA